MVGVLDQAGLAFAAGAFGGMQQKELSDGIVRAFQTGVGLSYVPIHEGGRAAPRELLHRGVAPRVGTPSHGSCFKFYYGKR